MKELINKIEVYHSLSPEDITVLEKNISKVKFKAGDLITEINQVPTLSGLIISGIFRYFYIDENGQEVTALFVKENNFVLKMDSFLDQTPSPESIEAVTDGELLLLTRDDFLVVKESIPFFQATLAKIAADFLMEITNFNRSLIDLEAKEKYLAFMEKYPTILNRVKLSYIASFLGMTQSTLSRIRKEVFKPS